MRFIQFSLILLIFTFCGLLTVAAQDEDAETIDTSEVTTEATTRKTRKPPPPRTTITPIDALDEESCVKKRKGCCDQIHLGDEGTLTKCFTLHQSKLPQRGENDPSKLFKFMSCFVECMYKQRKYLGKGDNINMKMVKLNAAKVYANYPKERDYHIKTMDFCRKDAVNTYNIIKMNPAGRVILKDACKPYYMFVFLCEGTYHRKHECPYFRWEGKPKTDEEQECKEAKERCYEIDGLEVNEHPL